MWVYNKEKGELTNLERVDSIYVAAVDQEGYVYWLFNPDEDDYDEINGYAVCNNGHVIAGPYTTEAKAFEELTKIVCNLNLAASTVYTCDVSDLEKKEENEFVKENKEPVLQTRV